MNEALGVIFDMDGVLTDTAALHRQSWREVAALYGFDLDERTNDRMRGLTRPESLRVFLEYAGPRVPAVDSDRIITLKNELFLKMVARLSPEDALPGVHELIGALRARGVRLAVASSSRNVRTVLERLGLVAMFDALIDANIAPRSKPDPQAFLMAADAIGVPPARCVAIEDGQAGVDAAREAGMAVVGLAPPGRLTRVDLHVTTLAGLEAERLIELARAGAPRLGGSVH